MFFYIHKRLKSIAPNCKQFAKARNQIMNWLECDGKTTKQLRNSEMHMEMANIESEGEGEGEGEKDVTRTPIITAYKQRA